MLHLFENQDGHNLYFNTDYKQDKDKNNTNSNFTYHPKINKKWIISHSHEFPTAGAEKACLHKDCNVGDNLLTLRWLPLAGKRIIQRSII